MRVEYEQVRNWQQFQIMHEILKAAFGTSKTETSSTPTSTPDHNVMTPRNADEAAWMLRKVFGR